MLRRFISFNKHICKKIEKFLPQSKFNVFDAYEMTVARYMNARQGQTIADVGGGASCPFVKYKAPGSGARIIAVDISDEGMQHNEDVDERRVANIMESLPFSPEEVDLMVSRSVLEHLTDVEGFIANSHAALKSGGYTVHLLPGRFAPFALINRALPKALSRKLLFFLHPESKGVGGFPAFYDRCYYSAITASFEKHGFEVADCQLSYHQSRYFFFFVPLYLLSASYETLIRTLGAKNLCAYILIVARKR